MAVGGNASSAIAAPGPSGGEAQYAESGDADTHSVYSARDSRFRHGVDVSSFIWPLEREGPRPLPSVWR